LTLTAKVSRSTHVRETLAFQPVIIIGAARSGTNMLRDALTRLPGVVTWPCDEINYMWRHYHATFPNDELSTTQATPRVRRYLRGFFSRLAHRTGARYVVEKTCANSLRVDYVRAVFPEAKFIFLVRDGRDVVASAMKRWHAKIELRYLLKKARFVPPGDVPVYGWRFVRNHVYRLVSRERRLRSWGPRFAGIDEMLARHPLAEVCAEQWRRSVDLASKSLAGLPPRQVLKVRYEDCVEQPAEHLSRIAAFMEVPHNSRQMQTIAVQIFNNSRGNWRTQFKPAELELVTQRVRPTLERWGYSAEPLASSPRNKDLAA
jgi:hypothetical protein